MTSSLVGSEMCIRDRAKAALLAQAPLAFQGVEREEADALQQEYLERTGPVSYTHLTLPTICSV
eukprot:3519685-Prorocentrum_lima.AAC.1